MSPLPRSFHLDLGLDGHSQAQQMVFVLAGIEHDFHRHALHDFHVIAGGIFRRQQD